MKLQAIAMLGAALAAAMPAAAGVTVTFQEVGSDVEMTLSGTLDISGFLYLTQGETIASGVQSDDFLFYGPSGANGAWVWGGGVSGPSWTGPSAIGDGSLHVASNFSGDVFGTFWNDPQIITPPNYVSGTALSSFASYQGQTIDSLGLDVGTYVWTWETASGGTDSMTINVVPAPGAAVMLSLAGLAGMRRRR